jgi:hypothetical protein
MGESIGKPCFSIREQGFVLFTPLEKKSITGLTSILYPVSPVAATCPPKPLDSTATAIGDGGSIQKPVSIL